MSTAPDTLRSAAPLDVAGIRDDFPALDQKIRGRDLVYLDNAATTHKPRVVIEALEQYYSQQNSNIHRGVHFLSQQATFAYERARARIRLFLNAKENGEIVFVRGTTEGINLVAQSYGGLNLQEGDEVVVSHMEHHSNIIPWQTVCEQKGAILKVVPIDDDGEFIFEEYERILSDRTRLVAVTHASNALGTINPVGEIIRLAHDRGAKVLIDGAQGVPHLPVDVAALNCDFYAFSAHKLFGPTGVGVLYGKMPLLESMPPYQRGGSMIKSVTFEKTTYADLPAKFEAGTPHIAGGIGMETAVDYVTGLGPERIAAYETDLLQYATDRLAEVDGLRIVGTAKNKVGVLSFVMDAAHPHDIGTILDAEGIAVRAGHHCAQPTMQRFGVPATVRASLAFYNTHSEMDALVGALQKVNEVFR